MSLKHLSLALGVLFLWLWGIGTPCQADSIDVTAKISLSSSPKRIKLIGKLAYLAQGDCLVTLDVSDRDHPRPVNRLQAGTEIIDFDTTGTTLLYLAGDRVLNFSIGIVDITKPTTPTLQLVIPEISGAPQQGGHPGPALATPSCRATA